MTKNIYLTNYQSVIFNAIENKIESNTFLVPCNTYMDDDYFSVSTQQALLWLTRGQWRRGAGGRERERGRERETFARYAAANKK